MACLVVLVSGLHEQNQSKAARAGSAIVYPTSSASTSHQVNHQSQSMRYRLAGETRWLLSAARKLVGLIQLRSFGEASAVPMRAWTVREESRCLSSWTALAAHRNTKMHGYSKR